MVWFDIGRLITIMAA